VEEEVAVPVNNRKRAAPSPEEGEDEESMPVWGIHLIASVRKDAIAAYWKSDEWQRQKDVLIQARVDAIEAKMEPHIRANFQKKLEEEMREAAEKKKKNSEPAAAAAIVNQ
jgi:hypothetical protein